MRELMAKDISPFTKILAKMELKDAVKAMFNKDKPENQSGTLVSELIWGVIENYYKCEKDFFTFIADLEGKTSDEISELSLNDFISLVTELFSEKNFSFFKFAAKQTQPK